MIIVNHASKCFGETKAVNDISFHVHEGETLVLLGTSGCGKTTLLRMINRLLALSGGSIQVNGKNILDQKPEILRQGIGYVLQNHGLFPHYTVNENLATVPNLLKWDKNRISQRAEDLLQKLHLPTDILNSYPNQLSGGQQQRVGLARALMADPPILLMDEPLGALDPITRTSIRKEFTNLDELKKKTIIMVTHDVQEAFELGDRICLMSKGRIEQIGTPSELLFQPTTDFVSDFLNEQRLKLQFQTIKIIDIWKFIQVAEMSTYAQITSISTDFWTAIGLISDTNASLTFKVDDLAKSANISQLMEAYQLYIGQKHG